MAAALFANTCIAASASNAGKKEVKTIETPASDSRIEYTGRVLTEGNDVSYDWSGVYARIRFKGSSLAVRCSDTGNSWFNVWIDKEMDPVMDSKFMVAAKDTVIYLASGLGKGEHTVILQKRTEGEQGRITLHSFISQDEILQADGRKGRHIEFVGDSYTCGYGTESASKNDPFEARTENCALTYAAITARYFDADYNLVSHSGQGIARNYDDFRPGYNMPDRYSQTFDMDENTVWDASKAAYRPDAVVIYLCTNDFSTGRQPHQTAFCNRYVELLNKIRNNYPEDVSYMSRNYRKMDGSSSIIESCLIRTHTLKHGFGLVTCGFMNRLVGILCWKGQNLESRRHLILIRMVGSGRMAFSKSVPE